MNGTFLFKNIKAGNYELAVDYVGYKLPKVEKIAIGAGEVKSIHLRLQEISGQLSEVVVNADRSRETDNYARRLEKMLIR